MKTKSKLPKGQIGYSMTNGLFRVVRTPNPRAIVCAVVPCRTRKEAAAVVRLHAMEQDALAILIAAQIFHPHLDNRARDKSAVTHELAYVIMTALGLAKEGKEL